MRDVRNLTKSNHLEACVEKWGSMSMTQSANFALFTNSKISVTNELLTLMMLHSFEGYFGQVVEGENGFLSFECSRPENIEICLFKC